jgi:AAA domain
VWRHVLEAYRESPIKPPASKQSILTTHAYEDYERSVTSRIEGTDRRAGLEKEGRGITALEGKWRAAMRHWGSERMKADAARPNPRGVNSPQLDPQPEPKIDPKTGEPLPLILTAKQFMDGFQPPVYLVDGILQRGYLWALTARTNHGKTAVALYIAQCVARGQDMHSRPVKGGTVLVLVGENPQDVRARLLVLAEAYGFDPAIVKMRFIDGVVDLAAAMPAIKAETDKIDDLMLIIVDTAAAYFPGDDSNNNSQQGAYARLLRKLTALRGLPAVLVNCHPVKNAARDNLLPLGGSAFLNEIDGNLTLWEEADKKVQLHWQGKFRGPEFEPLDFELRVAQSDKVHDEQGRLLPSVVAVPLARMALEASSSTLEADENLVLDALYDERNASQDRLATKCGFLIDGRPSRTKVHRILKTLADYKFVVKHRRGKYRLTAKGRAEIGHADDDE